MSSVYSESIYLPSMCIDGVATNQGSGSDVELNICLSGVGVPSPWLAVSLAGRSVVREVVVYGRSDCCNGLLQDFEVWVGDVVGAPG